jgi:DNA-binding YbaB/EbfC family protein
MNVEKMMKDLQRMQSKLRDEIETLEIEGTSGGGAVTARVNGKKDLVGLTLTAEAITPEDPGMMQDLIIVAINDAGRKIDAEIERKTQALAGGLKIPGRS